MEKETIAHSVAYNRPLPLNYQDIQYREKFIAEYFQSREVLLCKLKRGFVSPYGVVFKRCRLVPESLYHGFSALAYYPSFFKKILLNKVRRLEGCYIDGFYAYYNNYYHFVCDILPRLFSVIDYVDSARVLIPENRPTFVDAYLKLLGVEQVEYIAENELVLAEELLLPSFTAGKHSHNPPIIRELASFLKNSVDDATSSSLPTNIYVSRRKARYRRLQNEAAVIAKVQQFGFTPIDFEELSVPDQIRLMKGVSRMIAVHGAGMTNMMFMQEGGLVMELVHPGHHIDCFYNLACAMGHKMLIVQGEDPANSADVIHADFSIDIFRLEHYLKNFCLGH